MTNPKRRYTRNNASAFVVRVNSIGNPCMEGKIEHIQSGQVQVFRSVLEFIHLVEQKLEETGFPQPATEIRSWGGGCANKATGGMTMEKQGDTEREVCFGSSTFLIRIQFLQNTSWQGTIQWLEGKQTKSFRSLLELIMLINESLEMSSSTGEGLHIRSWKEKEEVS